MVFRGRRGRLSKVRAVVKFQNGSGVLRLRKGWVEAGRAQRQLKPVSYLFWAL